MKIYMFYILDFNKKEIRRTVRFFLKFYFISIQLPIVIFSNNYCFFKEKDFSASNNLTSEIYHILFCLILDLFSLSSNIDTFFF